MATEIKNFVPQVTFYHCFTDSPTSQYRNKSLSKTISCHEEYFGAPAAWNYSEAGHGKGPRDPIGGTAKRTADHAVKHGKASIQDAWSLNGGEQSKITYLFSFQLRTMIEVRLFSQVHARTSVQFKEQWKFTLSLELAQTKSMLETLHAIA